MESIKRISSVVFIAAILIIIPTAYFMNQPNYTYRLNVPFVHQFRDDACDPACYEMVYKYYGFNRTQQEIYTDKNFEVDNAKSYGFIAYAKQMQLNETVVITELSSFLSRHIPIIVHQIGASEGKPSLAHARVVIGISSTLVLVNDPNSQYGGEAWSLKDFIEAWKTPPWGTYIIIEKGD